MSGRDSGRKPVVSAMSSPGASERKSRDGDGDDDLSTASAASRGANQLGYDLNIIFQSHASNIPHINTWIDELVTMTERGNPMKKYPTTEELVDILQRYDAVFRELLRQTSIFSEPITKMLAKIWAGTLKLLDYMVKSYHRYVKHTSNIQEQAEVLLAEKHEQMVANKVREDEFDLEKTYLKAKIRNLEAQIESMAATKREMDRENLSLRGILHRYVESEGMNHPVWEVTNEDADNNPGSVLHDPTERELVDSGRHSLRSMNRLDIEMNETLARALKEEDQQKFIIKEIMSLLERNQTIFGTGARIDDKWVPGAVKNITFAESGVQVDEKAQFGTVTDLIEENPEEMEIPVPVVTKTPNIAGAEIPYLLRSRMTTFPQVLRVSTAAWACQSIFAIYVDKIEQDVMRKDKGLPKLNLCEHIYEYYMRQLNMEVLVDAVIAQLVRACEAHYKSVRRVALFSSQLGLYEKEEPPSMDVRDTDFVLSVLSALMDLGELQAEKASRRKLTKRSVIVRSDISRAAAVSVTEKLFANWLPDGGQDYVVKVKTMSQTEKGSKYVDVDEFIEVLIEPWHTVRLNWEEHVAYLFRDNCTVQRVLAECAFANDNGVPAKDTLLSQLSKAGSKDSMRRPMRAFQKFVSAGKPDDASTRPPDQATQREPVVEVMTHKAFVTTVLMVNPMLSVSEAERLYELGVETSHKRVLRDVELIWLRCTHTESKSSTTRQKEEERKRHSDLVPPSVSEHPYYVNLKTGLSQWTKPYHHHTFRSADFEFDTFLKILIQNDVLDRSPLADLLHMTPRDLWPNADMFLKMKKKEQERDASSPQHK